MLEKTRQRYLKNRRQFDSDFYESYMTKQKRNSAEYIVRHTDIKFQKLIHAMNLLGLKEDLVGIADGTISGAINRFYFQLGDCILSINEENKNLVITYDPLPPSGITPIDISSLTDDEAKIDALLELIGDPELLATTGNTTVRAALKEIDERLNDFSFEYDTTDNIAVICRENI